jgi:hypothetical protein
MPILILKGPGPRGAASKFVDVAPQRPRIASLLENAMTEAYYGQAAARGNSFDFANRIERFGLDTDEARSLSASVA